MKGHEVFFVGNAVNNVSKKRLASGKTLASFSIAQDANPLNLDSNKVNYWRIECWDQVAEKIAASSISLNTDSDEHVDIGTIKGARVGIHGYVEIRTFENEDGTKVTTPIVTADEVFFSTHFGPLEAYRHPIPNARPKTPPAATVEPPEGE